MIAASVDDVVALYERWGLDHYDEEISQLDHALQTAALARAADAPDHLVAAALLHDVGHLLDLEAGGGEPATGGDLQHESTGARFLAGLFPASVTAPIALHVRAKRFRCAVDVGYHEALSAGSRRSLELQGGPMSPSERAEFEQNPAHETAVRLREWDDGGKVESVDVVPFDHYLPLLQSVVIENRSK